MMLKHAHATRLSFASWFPLFSSVSTHYHEARKTTAWLHQQRPGHSVYLRFDLRPFGAWRHCPASFPLCCIHYWRRHWKSLRR
ncbi:hypothetical protein BJX99DRAFT_236337 [Aspergillus californicus]